MKIKKIVPMSFKRKLDFLWKGCISMMLTLMNLLLFEERKLGLSKIFNLLESHPKMDVKDLTFRSTSVKIAANLEKSRVLYLKNKIQYGQADENCEVEQQSGLCREEGIKETQTNACNGKRLIECIPSLRTAECEDLVDFIECSPQKDYSLWLNNRSKFVKWNLERKQLLKCQKRKKRAFDMMKGHNLIAKIGAGKGIKVKLQEWRSEYIKDRRHQTDGKEPSANHADSSKFDDFVKPIEGRPEEDEGQAGLLKNKSKKRKRTFAIVREYDLRERVAGKK